jgi:Zn-dependent M28 family amino/carboxypeptidase
VRPDEPFSALPTFSPLPTPTALPESFSGDLAYGHVLSQVSYGPRPPGSAMLHTTGEWIKARLLEYGWAVEEQAFTYRDTPIRNLIARKGEGPVVILGAHYDTRRRADRDGQEPSAPVPGANDGASGVAVLLELARTLDVAATPYQIWLAFFDAEDNGGLDGWEWIVGSSYTAEHLTVQPSFVVIVDMIGDADQQLYLEQNSTPEVRDRIWAVAAQLGYGAYFVSRPGYSMTDDHTPFLRRGLRAVDIIDFDYPYWHTTADTADKVSPASLERVGRTLQAFLEQPSPLGEP